MRHGLLISCVGGMLGLAFLVAKADAYPAVGSVMAKATDPGASFVEHVGWRRGGYYYRPYRYYNPYRSYRYDYYRPYRYDYYRPYRPYRYHYYPRHYRHGYY